MKALVDKQIDSLAQDASRIPGVLVVDDEHMVRILVQLCLERNGFEVWLASNGDEAIELYQDNKDCIDVVLLDVCMPGLDGPHTLAALRKLNPKVRACFMSGNLGAFRSEELIQLGAACVIAKPFHLNELASQLWQLANGEVAEPQAARNV
jgi:two-component system, OmpR family, response regulator